MNELNKKKLLSGAVACALLIGAVALVQRFPLVSDFLTASAQIPATARFASSTKPMAGKQSAASLVAAVSSVVNINTASKERLMTLHGIGSAKSDAIVNYRNAHGIFYRPEDIMNVSGIGTAMYESIRNTITVGNVTPPRAKPPLSALAPAATSSPAHVVISQ
ncbi:MAG: helix-hairpin-helix domain-containing protein, partial [Patescibacteria group bacterium]|nr:helix-hairpin-helix domain-containing protein [Patescibacteria group bacterium]